MIQGLDSLSEEDAELLAYAHLKCRDTMSDQDWDENPLPAAGRTTAKMRRQQMLAWDAMVFPMVYASEKCDDAENLKMPGAELNPRLRVGVYVDGFNIYHGGQKIFEEHKRGKQKDWRWLNLGSLARDIISLGSSWPKHDIVKLIYFTARIKGDRERAKRQDACLEALRRYSSARIVQGKFSSRKKIKRPAAKSGVWGDKGTLLRVVETGKEKGSDVNIACHALKDIYEKKIDAMVLVSNDSDFQTLMAFAAERVPVGLINPRGQKTSAELEKSSSWFWVLESSDFRNHQLPDEPPLKKPKSW